MIQVELSTAEIAIEPGSTAQLTVTVTNQSAEADHVFLEIEGIDVEWYALPVASLTLPSQGTQAARVLFRVARSSSSTAGTYPFVVRVRSMETGESGVQPASLVVKPFSAIQVELNPKRAVSTFFQHAPSVDVVVSNLSNHEDTLDLFGTEPDDACAFEFERERLTVKPGHTETVGLTAEPVTRSILGGSRLYAYTVTARSVRDSFVSSTAHGQLERRALLSVVSLLSLIALILIVVAVVVFRPRPAVIQAFNVSPRQVVAGESVTLSWDVTGATEGVFIQPDNQKRPAAGTVTLNPSQTTTYTLVARYGDDKEVRDSATVVVTPAPPVASPRISSFITSRKRIHQGDEVKLWWKAENVKTVMLNPLGRQGEYPLYTSQIVKPDTTTTYELAAQGPGGTVIKTIKIEVVRPTESIAEIQSFRARPETITEGAKTTLTWSTSDAASVEIDNNVGSALKPDGKVEVSPGMTTTYTLRAIDNRGNAVTRTVTVTVNPPEPVVEPTVPDEQGATPPSPNPPP